MCILPLREDASGEGGRRATFQTDTCPPHAIVRWARRNAVLLAGLDLERRPDLRPIATESVSVAQDLFLGGIRRVGCRACLDLERELIPGTAAGSLVEM